MAGFFRQVAQRALQATPQLHSAAALPYASARDAGGDAWTAESEQRVPASETKSADIATTDPLPKILALRQEPVATRDSPTANRTPSRSAAGKKKTSAIRTARKPRKPAKPARRGEPAPSRLSAEPSRLIAVKGDLSPAATIKSEPMRSDTDKHARPAHRRPARAQVRSARTAPRTRSATASKNAATSDTHEVHIHIGRVELAAIGAPAPAKRAASSEKRPMTLNEYLQHRRSPNAGSP